MNITEIASGIEQARADIALLARLQDAPARLKRLEADHKPALAKQAEAEAKQAAADYEASFCGVTDIRVAKVGPPENLLRTKFEITYTKPEYDSRLGQSIPKTFLVHGFKALPDCAMLFLAEKRPNEIPPAIAALAPGNPHGALQAYLIGQRRGHL